MTMIPTPPHGDRDGDTYSAGQDCIRLNRQADDVWRVMRDGNWRSLRELSDQAGHPEASVSARLRDFRKAQFGSHEVERQRVQGGMYRYRLVVNQGARMAGGNDNSAPEMAA